jgi:hypothetical protein
MAVCGIFELALMGSFGTCNTLLQKMHTVAARLLGGLPPYWQEFPQLGNEKNRMTGGRGANSVCETAEVQQPA